MMNTAVDAERGDVHASLVDPMVLEQVGPGGVGGNEHAGGAAEPGVELPAPPGVHVGRGLGQPLVGEIVHHHHDPGAAGRRRDEVRRQQHVELDRPLDARDPQPRRHRPEHAGGESGSLLAEVRRKRAQLDKLGHKDPPVNINAGSSGTGL